MESFINNRYRVIKQLGTGGMGAVYLVEDVLHDNAPIALKTIRADLLLERNLTQFKYEFAALGQLYHPNLVRVYDFGVIADGNEYFFTMEYVPGEDLPTLARKRLETSPGDYSWLYEITVQVCRVLQYIHARGFIHYDVKPHNISLTENGTVKLMDFGLVGEVRGEGQLKIRGTPEYIAPELIRGGRVDHRVDLYSLGISLYELVTGHPPFTGVSSLIILRQHVENMPEPPRHYVDDLPDVLQTLILKLMAKEPINRYSSAEAVIQAINQLIGSSYPVETKETKRGYIQSGDFIGRAFELARLQGLLMRMMQGQGRLILITGPTGVGKTRLVRELRLRAQMQRVLVCEGVSQQHGGAPYHPWISILSQVISYQQATKSEVLQKHAGVLVNLMPELAELISSVIPINTAIVDEPDDRQGLMEAVLAFLLASERPLMIVLEDLHHADVETIELLTYLSRNSFRGRLLFCGVYRENELDDSHTLNLLIQQAHHINSQPESELQPYATSRSAMRQTSTSQFPIGDRSLPAYDLMQLRVLSETDCTELIRSMLGVRTLPPRLLSRLMTETGGNPLFIENLMQSLIEEDLLKYDGEKWHTDVNNLSRVPVTIQEAAQRRLDRLDDSSLDLLQWASVMGHWLSMNVLAEVCDMTPDQVFQVVAEMAHQHVLTINNQHGQVAYHFLTDQMREVIYNTLLPEAKAARHWRVGQALRKLYDENEVAEKLTWHFEQANDLKLALYYAKLTADKARQIYANETGISYYTKALDLLTQHPELDDLALKYQILSGRARCYNLLGYRKEQRTDLESMVQVGRTMKDPALQIHALTSLVDLANLLGDYGEAKRAAATAMTLTYKLNNHRLEAETLNSLGAACLRLGEYERAQVSHELALQLYREATPVKKQDCLGEALSLWHLGNVVLRENDSSKAQQYFSAALTIYQQLENKQGEATILNAFAKLNNNLLERIRYHEEALEVLLTIGDRDACVHTYNDLGIIYSHLGVYDKARHYLEQAVTIARGLTEKLRLIEYLEHLGFVYLATEDYKKAKKILEEGYRLARKHDSLLRLTNFQVLLGRLALSQRQLNRAAELLQKACAALRESDRPLPLAIALAWLGATRLALEDANSAKRATEEATKYLDNKTSTPTNVVDVLRYPMQTVWWWHYQALQTVSNWQEGEPLTDEAWFCLHNAHDMVMAPLANLGDENIQHHYMTAVMVNRNIITEWVARSSRWLQADDDLPEEVRPKENDRVEQAEDKLRRILEMSVHMGETHDIELLLNYVVEQMMELTTAERSFLALVDKVGQMDFKVARNRTDMNPDNLSFLGRVLEFSSRSVYESHPSTEYTAPPTTVSSTESLNSIKAELSYTIIGTVAQSRNSILLADALSDERFARQESVLDLQLRSVLTIPLIARSNLVGLIYADSRTQADCFTQDDLDTLTIFATQAAIAIENAQLYQQTINANKALEAWTRTLEQRVDARTAELQQANVSLLNRALQLQISGQVAQQIISILDLDDLLNQVVDAIQSTAGYYFVGIWLPADHQKLLHLRAGTGQLGKSIQDHQVELPFQSRNPVSEAYRTGRDHLVTNIREESGYITIAELPDTYAQYALPLHISHSTGPLERIIGVLDIHSNHAGAFGPDEEMVLQLLANQIATAIRNAQLYEAELRRRQLAESLEKAGRTLSSSLDFEKVPGRILEELAEVVPYERGIVLLQEKNELRSSAKHGFPDHKEAERLRIPVSVGDIYEQIVTSRKAILLDDVTQEATWRQLSWLPVNHSWMGVPLFSKGNVIGMLSLTRPQTSAFTMEEASIVSSFAAQAAISLENASLYTEITQLNEALEQRVQKRTDELNKAYLSLEQLNKTKTDFIKVSAHELRTPLTVISGYTQLVKTNPVVMEDVVLSMALDGILSGFERLHEVVNSMLDVAKIDSQTLEMHRERTILSVVIGQTCTRFNEALTERNLTLTVNNISGVPPIQADSRLLIKVFDNIVNNAIKYTPDGGKINISCRELTDNGQPSQVEVVISDTGIGIDAEHTDVIFEKFFQTGEMELHSSSKTRFKGGGPGLGLAIVKGIIRAHNGKIWAESAGHDDQLCPGSQFHVRLPIE
ncbi:GAF domain-containing protein [Anaerolineales bacterium HSG25]|nr:GAF domain-containing protein [Anaerolineales bacterium HSG25]